MSDVRFTALSAQVLRELTDTKYIERFADDAHSRLVAAYSPYPSSWSGVSRELQIRKHLWSYNSVTPASLQDRIDATNASLYPNVNDILQLLLITPVGLDFTNDTHKT